MRNIFLASWLGSLLLLAGCGGNTTTQGGALPFTVVSRSADATVTAGSFGGSQVTVKMPATALDGEQNYRFKAKIEVGGKVELHMRATPELKNGVVLKFERTIDTLKMSVNGADMSADIRPVVGRGDRELNVDFDIHQHGFPAHGVYFLNGKVAGTPGFNLPRQGTWGFVVEKATIRDFGMQAEAKHGH